MDRPTQLLAGRVLLLSPPDSFNAAYIRRSLQLCGVPVLTPPGPPTEAFANLSPDDWASITACVVVDLGRAMFADVSPKQRDVPFLFVGYEQGSWFPGPYSWLCPPFASYQVVDALTAMVKAAGSTMEAMMDLATLPIAPLAKPDGGGAAPKKARQKKPAA
ncbi:hypothetical protein [Sphingomonas crusticola]|uniref:hypothetical protein n=1 Tax=Sphingomonas crusticola TaxID=1697973 RepID=UPI000E2681DA|nr:hypothetical protein [Sphingomonas crusticola]